MNFQPPPGVVTVPIRLNRPDDVKSSIDNLEAKLVNVKRGIEELLLSLDAQDKVSWVAFTTKCSSLASDLSTIQANLRKSLLTNSNEDNGEFIKNQLILPHTISPDVNPKLLALTENRVPVWNHETAPSFLRTKLSPTIESEIGEVERDLQNINTSKNDYIKRITFLNRSLDNISNAVAEQMNQNKPSNKAKQPMFKNDETEMLVRGIYGGENILKGSNTQQRR
uniref:Mediator of RNA polymerase II transcription subunit 8 n=1 Tax=Panagrolaimus sp. ES5 TaxID=591445 RepID=A0AC34GNP5_9BILA